MLQLYYRLLFILFLNSIFIAKVCGQLYENDSIKKKFHVGTFYVDQKNNSFFENLHELLFGIKMSTSIKRTKTKEIHYLSHNDYPEHYIISMGEPLPDATQIITYYRIKWITTREYILIYRKSRIKTHWGQYTKYKTHMRRGDRIKVIIDSIDNNSYFYTEYYKNNISCKKLIKA